MNRTDSLIQTLLEGGVKVCFTKTLLRETSAVVQVIL